MVSYSYGYEPQAPQVVVLKEEAIIEIKLNRALETLLVFPHQIEHLSGSGLVNQGKGQVQYEVGVNRKTLTLRPLVRNFTVLMQVMVGGDVYAIQLNESSKPASVVRFQDDDRVGLEVRSKIQLPDVENLVRLPSAPRLKELVRLAKEEVFLKPQLPHLYEGSDSRSINASSKTTPYLYTLEKAVKFAKEDTLVFTGQIHYQANEDDDNSPKEFNIQLTINEKAQYAFTSFEIYRDAADPKKPLRFVGVLVGDGQGKPGHIALINDFNLTVTAEKPSQSLDSGGLKGNGKKWLGYGITIVTAGALIVKALTL